VPRRRLRILLISVGILAFLVLSGLLARYLAAESLERTAVLDLLRAEAGGKPAAVVGALQGCPAACQATARANAAALRGPGQVTILADMSATAYSVTGATGNTRVAWKLPGRLPTVQCVLVRRTGNPVSGISVALLGVSPPLPLQSDCP